MSEPAMDLNERRKRLREALASADTNDTTGFAAALQGASEQDRAALARTLPAAKLFKAEGPTPRACFVLAALGKPAAAAEEATDESLAAAHDRDQAWQLAFIDALSENQWHYGWPIARALIETHALAPESTNYLNWFVSNLTWNKHKKRKCDATEIAAMLAASNGVMLAEFWALFRVEGMGNNWNLTDRDDVWPGAVAILKDTVPGFRDRALDESLGALLRDFSASDIRWYLSVHRALDPTPDEIAARADRYLAVLAASPSTSVGLAQDMLARAIGRIAPAALLEPSAGVLGRSEKKLLTAQIKLLAALVKAHHEYAAQVSELAAAALETLPADVAAAARKLILPAQGGVPKPELPPGVGAPIAVPGPRRAAIPHEPERLAPIASEEQLWELVSACLEGVCHGRDLPRILDYLSRHPDATAGAAVLARADEVLTGVWDENGASPRRHLVYGLLSRAEGQPRQLRYKGFWRSLSLEMDEPVPEGAKLDVIRAFSYTTEPDGLWKASPVIHADGTSTHRVERCFRQGHQFLLPQTPTALLVTQCRASLGQVAMTPLPATTCEWQRTMLLPGQGRYNHGVFGADPKPVWLPVSQASGVRFAKSDLGVSGTQNEYTLRAEEAREQDGFDQIVQWAAWLLSENPDTLAAIYHPALDAAVRVVNVRGVGALLAALGQTRQAPRGPVWSALTLGLSAKMPEHRAAAAEAVAALAESGLLDPAPFAAEIAAHLKDELAFAGRLAAALADAATISPIVGYRVLQTLAALLPHLDGVNQSVKLIELTARLAADYGTPVPVPEALAGKRKGGSVMAVALRALDAVTPRPTPLAKDAAARAAVSLGN